MAESLVWANDAAAQYNDESDATYAIKSTLHPKPGEGSHFHHRNGDEWFFWAHGEKDQMIEKAQELSEENPGVPFRVYRYIYQ